ncbi:hypothetical protein D3C71_1053740 [compost metagenome]
MDCIPEPVYHFACSAMILCRVKLAGASFVTSVEDLVRYWKSSNLNRSKLTFPLSWRIMIRCFPCLIPLDLSALMFSDGDSGIL